MAALDIMLGYFHDSHSVKYSLSSLPRAETLGFSVHLNEKLS